MSKPVAKGELHLGLQLSCGEIHGEEPASPWLCPSSSVMIEGSMDSSTVHPMEMSYDSVTGAGYYMPPPITNKLAMASSDPLHLTVASHVPTIDLNLPPLESQTPIIPNGTWSSHAKTSNPFEWSSLEQVGRRNDLPFQPFILESSEVAKEYAQREETNNKGKRVDLFPEPVHALPQVVQEKQNIIPTKRRYNYPAKKMANLNEKIERLKREALCKPCERRSLHLIQADIDDLEAKKDEIHARVCGQQ